MTTLGEKLPTAMQICGSKFLKSRKVMYVWRANLLDPVAVAYRNDDVLRLVKVSPAAHG